MMNVPGSRKHQTNMAPSIDARYNVIDDDDNLEEQIRYANDSLSKYDVKKKIGSGEFCEVFKAVDRQTNQTVALKHLKILQMFDAKSRMDCLREIRLLRKLDHRNIIRHIESFFANNELYIVLEYADAGDLSKMLDYFRRKQIRLSEKNVWNFFEQICAGLVYMHSQRVMHRDIKPANVLINRDGSVKLGDLGLSLLLSATTENARSLVGTPYYMAPERLQEMEYNFKADIWSLGCLLYELVTLQPPFYEPSQNIQMLMNKIQTLNYVRIGSVEGNQFGEDLSPEIGYIVSSCLVLQSDHRIELDLIYGIAKRMNDWFQSDKNSGASSNGLLEVGGGLRTGLPASSQVIIDQQQPQQSQPKQQSEHSPSTVLFYGGTTPTTTTTVDNPHDPMTILMHTQESSYTDNIQNNGQFHNPHPHHQQHQYPNYYRQESPQFSSVTSEINDIPPVAQQYVTMEQSPGGYSNLSSMLGHRHQNHNNPVSIISQTDPIPIPSSSSTLIRAVAPAIATPDSSSSSSSLNPFSNSLSPNSDPTTIGHNNNNNNSMSIKKRMYSNIRNMF